MGSVRATITVVLTAECDCGETAYVELDAEPREAVDAVNDVRAELTGEGWSLDPVRCPACAEVACG